MDKQYQKRFIAQTYTISLSNALNQIILKILMKNGYCKIGVYRTLSRIKVFYFDSNENRMPHSIIENL